MYAIIRTGGKQYKVAEGDVITVERLAAEPGETLMFDEVLALDGGDGLTVGTPILADARVAGEVVDQTKAKKIIVFKKKKRHNYRRKRGHRQMLTKVRITALSASADRPKEQTDGA